MMSAISHAQRQQEQAEDILWRLLAREQGTTPEQAQRSPEGRILARALTRIHLQRVWLLRAAVDTLPMAVACADVHSWLCTLIADREDPIRIGKLARSLVEWT